MSGSQKMETEVTQLLISCFSKCPTPLLSHHHTQAALSEHLSFMICRSSSQKELQAFSGNYSGCPQRCLICIQRGKERFAFPSTLKAQYECTTTSFKKNPKKSYLQGNFSDVLIGQLLLFTTDLIVTGKSKYLSALAQHTPYLQSQNSKCGYLKIKDAFNLSLQNKHFLEKAQTCTHVSKGTLKDTSPYSTF